MRWIGILRSLPSRRDLLRGLGGVGSLLATPLLPGIVDAKKNRKRRRKKKDKKAKPNRFGCLDVGDPCKNADQCCSGICEGKKCRSQTTGTCNQKGPEICSVGPPLALTCNNNDACRCFSTTAGSIACAMFINGEQNCADCARDPDCEALGFPPGSVCAPFTVGPCAGNCPSGMACLSPCPCFDGQLPCRNECLPPCDLDEFRNPETCQCQACTAIGAPCGTDDECCGENLCRSNGNETVCILGT